MAISEETGGGLNGTMLMQPAGMPYGGGNSGFGNESGWWIILLFLLLIGNNGWGNNSGNGGGGSTNYYDYGVQRGFDQSAIMSGINTINANVTSGFGDVQQALCSGFANAETAANARQMANMQQLFGVQSSLQNCCCENRAGIESLRYTVATENCADRQTINEGVRDIITNQTANTQRILDQLCQDKIDAKNEKIADLERQLTMANLSASQIAQTAQIQRGQVAEVDALYQRLRDCPVPTMPVYGSQPIFTCPNNNNGCGCGCGNNNF